MTKKEWINYMFRLINPAKGLETSCREMLGNMYDIAYHNGAIKLADVLSDTKEDGDD